MVGLYVSKPLYDWCTSRSGWLPSNFYHMGFFKGTLKRKNDFSISKSPFHYTESATVGVRTLLLGKKTCKGELQVATLP